jgi:hypothetical protein
MSAAATAAGYLYASGRLRGRAQREQESHDEQHAAERPKVARPERPRIERPRVERAQREREIRVAALPSPAEAQAPAKPRRTPTIQYRTKRWRPADE